MNKFVADCLCLVLPKKRWRRAVRARTKEGREQMRQEHFRAALGADGLFHWKDLTFDLRNEPNTLFIRDEILESGEYDFYIDRPCVVLDIGMNIGDTPLYFARMPHVTRVYCYEPIPATYEWAVSNFKLNPALSGKIVPTCAGVSDKAGTIEIEMDFRDGTGGAAIEMVNDEHKKAIEGADYILKDRGAVKKQTIRVEGAEEIVRAILSKHPGEALVMKCDAEGVEWKIIPLLIEKGLLAKVDVLMLEYHYQPPGALLKMLTDAGFACFLRDLKAQKHAEIGNIYAARRRPG